MYDLSKILIGLGVFAALVLLPFWFNVGANYEEPKLQLPKDEKNCVEETEWMRTSHMKLLDDWRHWVVRDGKRVYTSEAFHKDYNMSLQNTCMDCHKSKAEFCDKCHEKSGVTPYCWDCHVPPKEAK